MLRLSILALFAAALLAQPAKDFDPAPPEVDQALRARVSEFLHYHVTGEFRKAEALVAEDSKDIFYNRNKPRYISCKSFASIHYSDRFTKAYVTAICAIPMLIQPSDNEVQADGQPQVPTGPPTVPIPASWKLENGKWCWYLDKSIDRISPFGPMGGMPAAPAPVPGAILPMVDLPLASAAPAQPQSSAADDAGIRAAIQAVHVPVTAAAFGPVAPEALHHVKFEPGEITLQVGASARIKVANDAEDLRQLMVLGQLAGIEAKLESSNVKGGDSTILNLKATEGAKSGTLNVVVATTGEMLSLPITIK